MNTSNEAYLTQAAIDELLEKGEITPVTGSNPPEFKLADKNAVPAGDYDMTQIYQEKKAALDSLRIFLIIENGALGNF